MTDLLHSCYFQCTMPPFVKSSFPRAGTILFITTIGLRIILLVQRHQRKRKQEENVAFDKKNKKS